MKKIFVTGATGHLGLHVCRLCVERGYLVAAVFRSEPVGVARVQGVDYFEGDITQPESYARHLKGSSTVIHCAASVAFGGKASETFATNLVATKVLLARASEAGVERFLHISTRGTRIACADRAVSNEQQPFRNLASVDNYISSKISAEREVLSPSRDDDGMTRIVLSPTALYSGIDRKPGPVGKLISEFLYGHPILCPQGGINIIDVRDAAVATVNAIERGAHEQVYFLGGVNIDLCEFYAKLSALTGRPRPMFSLPFFPLYAASQLAAVISKLASRSIGPTPYKVRTFCQRESFCDASKARRDLGLPAPTLRESLTDAIEYFLKSRHD